MSDAQRVRDPSVEDDGRQPRQAIELVAFSTHATTSHHSDRSYKTRVRTVLPTISQHTSPRQTPKQCVDATTPEGHGRARRLSMTSAAGRLAHFVRQRLASPLA